MGEMELDEALKRAANIIKLDEQATYHGLKCVSCGKRNTKVYPHKVKCMSCATEFSMKDWWDNTNV